MVPLKRKGSFQHRPHLLRIAAWPASQPIEKIGGPRVVPQPRDFNNLQCQTSLTALTGAKGIFLHCQTIVTTGGEFGSGVNMSR
jgi:hypothetical protein